MSAAGVLRLCEHPLQRCGAWAVAVFAGRERPEQVTPAELAEVAERIVADVVAAATAGKGSSAYDWWKVLFALYPNSKPTHAKRERDPARLGSEVAALFAPERRGSGLWPCTFCGEPCSVLWSKPLLPMFDSVRAVNTVPPGLAGWPVCRSCRVALWTLPYGAWVTAGSATVLTSESPAVERDFAARNVRRASRVQQVGFDALPTGVGPEAVTLQALKVHASDQAVTATLWMFKNDNQEPWLRVTGTRTGIGRFLRRMLADPECRAGWRDLQHRLERRDGSNRVILDGATAAARTLFDHEGAHTDRLLFDLRNLSADTDRVLRPTLLRWRALCRLYLEVIHGMDINRVKPVAALLADWISAEKNPRGRFNEYRRVAGSGYELHRLLMSACARLFLDGNKPVDIAGVTSELLAAGPSGWRLRAQLFFEVMAELSRRGVVVGRDSDHSEEAEEAAMKFDVLNTGEMEEEYA